MENGVATKYLDHYLSWFQFLDIVRYRVDNTSITKMLVDSCLFPTNETYYSLRTYELWNSKWERRCCPLDKRNLIFHLIGALVCFILFIIGMLFSDQFPLLILIGIFGLSGFSFLIFRIFMTVKSGINDNNWTKIINIEL